MSLLRNIRIPRGPFSHLVPVQRPLLPAWGHSIAFSQSRPFASKGGKDKKRDKHGELDQHPGKESKRTTNADGLVPASQRILTGEEYFKAEEKMKAIADKFRKEVADSETRASGRVTPIVLAPVRVVLPNSNGKPARLEEVATVGVKEGTTLIITVFEEASLKYVEQALYEAKLPGIIPQKVDNQTIKVPVPKPTVEARHALYNVSQRRAEEYRSQIRKQQEISVKKGGYPKRSPELDEFKQLTQRFIGEVDKILEGFRKIANPK